MNEIIAGLIKEGLSAAVYTETTDCEIEPCGFMTYDRELVKMPIDKLRESNKKLRQRAAAGTMP